MENVKSMVTLYDGKFKDSVLDAFRELGYDMFYAVLDAADYGVPQHRQRVFFFGSKLDANIEVPKPTHGKGRKPYAVLGDCIMDLVDKGKHGEKPRAAEPLGEGDPQIQAHFGRGQTSKIGAPAGGHTKNKFWKFIQAA